MTDDVQPDLTRTPVGRVVATERKPNTPHEFHFWTAVDSPIGIGTIVRVDGPAPVGNSIPHVYGVVAEGVSYSDLQSPLHDVLGHDGRPYGGRDAATDRVEIRLYTAHTLRHIPEEPLQPVPLGEVFLADDADVAIALRMDAYTTGDTNTGIPIGVYRAGGMQSPVYLDADFLVGPEAAHLNISGVSGLATKTSAIEWMLASIFAHFPSHRGSVAAVCFNVKGPDLLFLDQAGRIEKSDRDLYELLGVPAAPFPQVQYFAPYTARGVALN
ncbi:MAG: ATP-binding protein, partial [Gemmatimonas sp.]